MKKRMSQARRIVYVCVVLVLLIAGAIALIELKTFTGFAGTQIPAEAGTITSVVLNHRQQSVFWQGFHGLVFGEPGFNEPQFEPATPGGISSEIFVFDCLPQGVVNELYASTNDSLDFSDVRPGTTDMIDVDFINFTENRTEMANKTFIENISILFGSTNITNIPGVYTYVNNNPNTTFYTGLLNVSGSLAFVSNVYPSSTFGFKGNLVRYQMLVPVANESVTYYFYRDPNDVCPQGEGGETLGSGFLTGTVFDEKGSLVPNATVSIGGNITFTNSTGGFSLFVAAGDHNLVTMKEGFVTNISMITITTGLTEIVNITLDFFHGYILDNGTVNGFVRDNSTNDSLSDVIISIGPYYLTSNGSGNFTQNVTAGTHIVSAALEGYDSFIGNITLVEEQNISYYINMTPVFTKQDESAVPFLNGTIQGYVTNNLTNESLVNVSVVVAGTGDTSESNGLYNITTFEGTRNLVATRSGFEPFTDSVVIEANNITEFNFSMIPVVPASGVGNGSVAGFVRTSLGLAIEGVAVSTAGNTNLTNATGGYHFPQVPAGSHVIVAVSDGFESHIGFINVSEGNVTYHNITMVTTTPEGLGPGSGVGQGPGQGTGTSDGVGPGEATSNAVQVQVQEERDLVEYELDLLRIIKKLRVGSFIRVPFEIKNHLDQPLTTDISIEGDVDVITRLSTNKLLIDSDSTSEFEITFLGNTEPGIYDGFLVLSGDIERRIPIYILLQDKDRLDVESLVIKIDPLTEKVTAGDVLKYRVDLQNMLIDEEYKVTLTHDLVGINTNRTEFVEKEDVAIQTQFSLLKNFRLPEDMEAGDYQILISAEYLGLRAEHSAIFTIVEPFYKYSVFGVVELWIVLWIAGGLSVLIGGFFGVRQYQLSKKRYKLPVDYSKLPGPGPRSAYLGLIAETKKKAYFELEQLNTHALTAGSTGSGKSVSAQVLTEEALMRGVSVIVFDPTVQWTGFLRKSQNQKMFDLFPKFGMKKSEARAFSGNVHQVNDAREIIDIKKYMKPGEIHVFVTNRLDPKDYDVFAANAIREVFHANLPESPQLRLIVIFDEVHRLLPKFGGSGEGFLQIERGAREFRKWGVGIMLISQVLTDFVGETKANINTEIQMRTRDPGDLDRIKNKYGGHMLQSLLKAATGTGMVENTAYNKGNPYFVSFRPLLHSTVRLSDEELENYNKYNDIVDDLEYQLEQLEKEGIDVFDLRLELKLSQDKIMSGNFNMVEIYLDGLKPRIVKQWEKIGKKPLKRKKRLVSEEDLKKEIEKAREEMDKVKKGMSEKKEEKKAAPPKESSGSKEPDDKVEKEEEEETPEAIHEEEYDILSLKSPYFLKLKRQVFQCVANNDKGGALKMYEDVQRLYSNASHEQKKVLLADCLEMQRRIRNM